MVTDTISDMLTRIRNANMVKHQIVQIPTTKMSKAIATIMKEEGFIENFEVYNQTPHSYLLLTPITKYNIKFHHQFQALLL